MTWNFSSGDMASNHIFILHAASIVDVLQPRKGIWSNRIFGVFWSSRFKHVHCSPWAPFVVSPCLIILMYAFHNVYGIHVSTNHSWRVTISFKISYSTMSRAFSVRLGGTKGALWCMDTLWNNKGMERGGFKALGCSYALQTRGQSSSGARRKYEGIRGRLKASQVCCVLKGEMKDMGCTLKGWRVKALGLWGVLMHSRGPRWHMTYVWRLKGKYCCL